jgi:ribosomal protein L14E/L6E/L27E
LKQIDERKVSVFDAAAVERIKRRGRQLLKNPRG